MLALLAYQTLNLENLIFHPREYITLFVLLVYLKAAKNKTIIIYKKWLQAADSCNDLFSIQHVAVLFHV